MTRDRGDAADRYIVTRYRKDPTVPARHQRAGWGAFDCRNPTAPVQLWATRAQAQAEADRLNRADRARLESLR